MSLIGDSVPRPPCIGATVESPCVVITNAKKQPQIRRSVSTQSFQEKPSLVRNIHGSVEAPRFLKSSPKSSPRKRKNSWGSLLKEMLSPGNIMQIAQENLNIFKQERQELKDSYPEKESIPDLPTTKFVFTFYHGYTVSAPTGTISSQLFGSHTYSESYTFDPDPLAYSQGCIAVEKLRTHQVGEIIAMSLGQMSYGSGPHWWVDIVTVLDSASSITYEFHIHTLFSSTKGDYFAWRVLKPSPTYIKYTDKLDCVLSSSEKSGNAMAYTFTLSLEKVTWEVPITSKELTELVKCISGWFGTKTWYYHRCDDQVLYKDVSYKRVALPPKSKLRKPQVAEAFVKDVIKSPFLVRAEMIMTKFAIASYLADYEASLLHEKH